MGFFDKVKSLKNAITGGGARVSLSAPQFTLGAPFEVIVKVDVEDDDLKIDGVNLKIEGRETIEIPDAEVEYASGENSERVEELVTAEVSTTSLEIAVSGEQTLEANQHYEWTVTAELPADALPRYAGKYCQHNYIALASLDCFGNDPDSGWVELDAAD